MNTNIRKTDCAKPGKSGLAANPVVMALEVRGPGLDENHINRLKLLLSEGLS